MIPLLNLTLNVAVQRSTFSLQLSPELYSPRVSDSLVSSVPADFHPARERSVRSAEQLLHH